jgi:hypothetical protein
MGQVANSIGNKKQSSGKLQQNMTKHPLNNINGCLIEINMMEITYGYKRLSLLNNNLRLAF